MTTKIRLARGGSKKRPYYSIIVTDSRNPRDCNWIEKIGTYDPLLANDNEKRVTINSDRAKYWLGVGAQMSERVHVFFNKAGIVETKPAFKPERKPKNAPEEAEAAPAAAPAAEAPKEEAKVEEAPKEEPKAEEKPAEAEEAKKEA